MADPADGPRRGSRKEVTTYREFSRCLHEHAQQPEITAQREYWGKVLGDSDPPLGQRLRDPAIDTASLLRSRVIETPFMPGASVRAVLLAALAVTLASWRAEQGQDPGAGAVVAVEGHGRADDLVGTDTSATVGWFTSVFPVRLGGVEIHRAAADPTEAAAFVAAVEATLTDVPTEGVGFGLLTAECPELAGAPAPEVVFDYLGRGDLIGTTTGDWSIAGEYALREESRTRTCRCGTRCRSPSVLRAGLHGRGCSPSGAGTAGCSVRRNWID